MKYSQFIFALMLSTALGLANAYAGGSCAPDGDTTSTCHWEIENGVLTISGSGAMVDYSSQSMYPWYSQKDSYTSVVVEGANETTGTTGVTSIGEYAFYRNNLTSVVIPDSVTSIGEAAFTGNNLTSVVIPDSVTSIGHAAFQSNNLTSVVIPDSVTSIEKGAFRNNNLTSVTIPDSVTEIGESVFDYNNLTSVVIPDSVTSIGEGAFYKNNLTSVTIPDSVTSIGSNAFASNNLTSVVIPDSVTSIGGNAFYKNNLTSVTIPDSVTSIGKSAFRNNNLTSVVIPDSVTSIEKSAFQGSQATDLVCSAENLQRYLDASGAFAASGDINLSCTTGDCKAVLEAWDTAKGTNYASRAKTILTNPDGSKAIYDLSGKFLGYKNKRIYTIDEANAVAGEKNRVSIRYR